MFKWLNKQGVKSDSGFEFQFTGRFTAEYREGKLVIDMYVESGGGTVTIYDGSFQPWLEQFRNPFEKKTEQVRLVKNIEQALKIQGLKLDLVSGPEPG